MHVSELSRRNETRKSRSERPRANLTGLHSSLEATGPCRRRRQSLGNRAKDVRKDPESSFARLNVVPEESGTKLYSEGVRANLVGLHAVLEATGLCSIRRQVLGNLAKAVRTTPESMLGTLQRCPGVVRHESPFGRSPCECDRAALFAQNH